MLNLLCDGCFAGYEGIANEWDEYSRYVNQDGVEMASVSSNVLFQLMSFLNG